MVGRIVAHVLTNNSIYGANTKILCFEEWCVKCRFPELLSEVLRKCVNDHML